MEKEKFDIETKFLKVPLTDDEKRDTAETLAIKTQELAELEAEKKSVASSYKERIERVQTEISMSARLYKDGYEMKPVDCVIYKEFETGNVYTIRTDTCQIVGSRKMTGADRQLTVVGEAPEESNAEIVAKKNIQREMSAETSAV